MARDIKVRLSINVNKWEFSEGEIEFFQKWFENSLRTLVELPSYDGDGFLRVADDKGSRDIARYSFVWKNVQKK